MSKTNMSNITKILLLTFLCLLNQIHSAHTIEKLKNFELNFLQKNDFALLFLTCNTPQCKEQEQRFQNFKNVLSNRSDISFGILENEKHIKWMIEEKYFLRNQLPQLLMFHNSELVEQYVPTDPKDFEEFFKIKDNSIIEVETKEQAMEKFNRVIFATTRTWLYSRSKEFKWFKTLSLTFNDNPFVLCKSSQCLKEFDAENDDYAILIETKDHKGFDKFTQFDDFYQMFNFVDERKKHLMHAFTDLVSAKIFTNYSYGLFYFWDKNNPDHYLPRLRFNRAYHLNKHKLYFIETEIKVGHEQTLASVAKVYEEDLPAVMLIDAITDKILKYKLENAELNEENILNFIEQYRDRELNEFLRSDKPIPNQSGPVFEVVASNIFNHIFEDKRDVLVFFYSPTCPHSKNMQVNVIEQLAKIIDPEKMSILKINAVRNEVDGIEINAFPLLKFYTAARKEFPFDFNHHDKSFDNVFEFIKKHATFDLSSMKAAYYKDDL